MTKQFRLRDNSDIREMQKRKLYFIILLNLKTLLETNKNIKN